MMADKNEIQVVVRAIDEMTAAVTQIEGVLKRLGATSQTSGQQAEESGGKFSKLGSVLQGIGMGIGMAVWNELSNILSQLVGLIPGLVSEGYQWADAVHQMQLETGMTAEQTSTLMAVFQELGIGTDTLDRTMAMLGKNLADTESKFTNLGIATRDANGNYLDSYTIIQNLRQAISAHGESLISTAAAQDLLSRSGYNLLPFLQLSDAQFKALATDAAQTGLVISQQTSEAAKEFGITMDRLGNTIEGTKVSIFAGLEPTLQSFVDGFTNFVQAHIQQIVSFVANVANFVMGVIGAIFGIDFSASTFASQINAMAASTDNANTAMKTTAASAGGASKANKALTDSIKDQIAAIDAQIAALTKRDQAETAATKQADLELAISTAQTELANLQASVVDTYGLSTAEQIKAQQKRVADIAAAQAKVAGAQGALGTFQESQADAAQKAVLEAQKSALQAQLTEITSAASGAAGGIKAAFAPIVGPGGTLDTMTAQGRNLSETLLGIGKPANDYTQALKDGMAAGKALSDWIKNTLIPGLQGLLSILQTIGAPFLWLIDRIGDLNTALNPVGGLGGIVKTVGGLVEDFLKPIGNMGDAIRGLKDDIDRFVNGLPHISFWTPWNTAGHAEGGVFDRPTMALVGEGREIEYLLPQSKLNAFAAMAIAGAQPSGGSGGGPTTLQIVIDKRVLGEVVNEALGRLMPAVTRGLVASS
jgi:hypothetical protein